MTPGEWEAAGAQLVERAGADALLDLAFTAARIQALATARIRAGESSAPLLMDAATAARFLGPSFTSKWLYNHWRDLPPECIHRIGKRVLFRGQNLRRWACDGGKSVPRVE